MVSTSFQLFPSTISSLSSSGESKYPTEMRTAERLGRRDTFVGCLDLVTERTSVDAESDFRIDEYAVDSPEL